MSKSIFIFNSCERVSDSYHAGGGLAVVAESLEDAVALVQSTSVDEGNGSGDDDKKMEIGEYALKNVASYLLDGEHENQIHSFPNAGCC